MDAKTIYRELRNKIEGWTEKGDFPEIDCHKYVDFYKKFPLFQFAKATAQRNVLVPIEDIYGDNWAFQNKNDRGRYPSPAKLLSLLSGYTNVNNDYWKRSIPPVGIHKIFDKYYLEEGNHRLYISKLLGRNSLLCDVYEYDYASFVKTSRLEYFGEAYCIVLDDNSAYQIDELEAIEFQKHKEFFK